MDKVESKSIFDGKPVVGTIDIQEPDPVNYKNIEKEFLRNHQNMAVADPNRTLELVPNYIEAGNGIVERMKKVEELPIEKITKESLFEKFKNLFRRNDFPEDNYKK